ncbi:MAG: hypothetical protein HRU11_10670 [Parvularculaceae bacterium]|nr:hypothetical protein [Parvularculaceae bacterium]
MLRMRILRAAVRWRQLKRQPVAAARLARLRQGLPFAASIAFNVALVLILAVGYTSFVAKGIVGAGIGERVVTVALFEADEIAPLEINPEDVETDEEVEDAEEADIAMDAIPEGNAIEDGEVEAAPSGDEPPDAELGQDVAVVKAGVATPQIALPEVDAGEGRPDGVVGVDCYTVFADDSDKALECAGRDILSGWREEVANLGEDWTRFARELGTANRQIRYGPLRARPDPRLQAYDPALQVPPEVAKAYEAHLARLRREQQEREYGRISKTRQDARERKGRDQDAATYDPISPDLPD